MTNSRGFTLIEVLVALSVLSIGVVALLKVQGESAAAASGARARLFAQIVAENQLVETITSPNPLTVGTTTGESRLADQAWQWTQDVAATGNRGVMRIQVVVRDAANGDLLAKLDGFQGRRR